MKAGAACFDYYQCSNNRRANKYWTKSNPGGIVEHIDDDSEESRDD